MQRFIDKQAQSDNQITLLAYLNEELAGVINITADQRPRVRHIGDIFWVSKSLLGKWSRQYLDGRSY